MPRYFFNVHDGRELRDTEGTNLADLRSAREEAVALTGELLKNNKGRFWAWGDWRLEVSDANDMILFTLMLIAVDAPAVKKPTHSATTG